MKQLLLTILVIFLVGILHAQDSKVIVKKMAGGSGQAKESVDVKVEVEDDNMTLILKIDGEEKLYEVNLKDIKALKNLEKELEHLDLDVNIMDLEGSHSDRHVRIFAGGNDSDDLHFGSEAGGFLGVQIQDITDQLRDYFKVKGDGGVLVTEVVEDSPAEKAGIEAGDIITKVGDVRISDAGELTRTIRKEKPEAVVDIVIVRKNREKSLKATLGSSGDSFSWFGKKGKGHNKDMKKFKKMKKKFKHKCTDDCGENCTIGDKMSMDWNVMAPEGIADMKKHQFLMQKNYSGDDLEKLKIEIEELRKEIQKLKE